MFNGLISDVRVVLENLEEGVGLEAVAAGDDQNPDLGRRSVY